MSAEIWEPMGALVHPIARAHYEVLFKLRFMEAHGDAFQDLFSDIMEKRYPGDFTRVKPWGRSGDMKNDGYLKSERLLFQVYAPSELQVDRTIAKMEDDFEGGHSNWAPYCDGWVFVTNEREGLPAPVAKRLLELDQVYPGVSVTSWGFEELRIRVFELGDHDIAGLLGPPLTILDVVDVRRADLEPILEGIAARRSSGMEEVEPVPQDKLDANGLSDHVRALLSGGMQGSRRVAEYFASYFDPQKGDDVAAAFAAEYGRLRGDGVAPDDIFYGLRLFAIGPAARIPRVEAAAYALLAYLFERCDIFEPALPPAAN